MFAKQFREAFKSWKVNYHIFLYGWSPSADCVPSSSTGQEKVLSACFYVIRTPPTCSSVIALPSDYLKEPLKPNVAQILLVMVLTQHTTQKIKYGVQTDRQRIS